MHTESARLGDCTIAGHDQVGGGPPRVSSRGSLSLTWLLGGAPLLPVGGALVHTESTRLGDCTIAGHIHVGGLRAFRLDVSVADLAAVGDLGKN